MNRRLLILNGIAIIAVVANHASHIGFVAMFWWTDKYLSVSVPNYDQMGSISYFILVAQQKLALFSVPSFLFVSGVFIAYVVKGSQSRLSWTMIKNRVINLLPPYLIWALVFLFVDIVIGGNRYSLSEIGLSIVSIRHSPFFFVPLLIVFFIISPPVALLAKYHWKLLFTIAILIQLVAIMKSYLRFLDFQNSVVNGVRLLFSGQVTEYFFFYAVGLIVGLQITEFKKILFKIRWPLLVSTLFFAVLAVIEAEWIFQTYDNQNWRSVTLSFPTFLYAISFILCYLSFDHIDIPFSKSLYQIGISTLGIYLIHKSVLIVLPKIIYHVAPLALGFQILLQAILISVAISVPLLIMNIVKRSPFRKHYRIFFG